MSVSRERSLLWAARKPVLGQVSRKMPASVLSDHHTTTDDDDSREFANAYQQQGAK
jgi:hypothetical protein